MKEKAIRAYRSPGRDPSRLKRGWRLAGDKLPATGYLKGSNRKKGSIPFLAFGCVITRLERRAYAKARLQCSRVVSDHPRD